MKDFLSDPAVQTAIKTLVLAAISYIIGLIFWSGAKKGGSGIKATLYTAAELKAAKQRRIDEERDAASRREAKSAADLMVANAEADLKRTQAQAVKRQSDIDAEVKSAECNARIRREREQADALAEHNKKKNEMELAAANRKLEMDTAVTYMTTTFDSFKPFLMAAAKGVNTLEWEKGDAIIMKKGYTGNGATDFAGKFLTISGVDRTSVMFEGSGAIYRRSDFDWVGRPSTV